MVAVAIASLGGCNETAVVSYCDGDTTGMKLVALWYRPDAAGGEKFIGMAPARLLACRRWSLFGWKITVIIWQYLLGASIIHDDLSKQEREFSPIETILTDKHNPSALTS